MIGAGNNKQVRASFIAFFSFWYLKPKRKREQQFKILAENILRDPGLAENPKFATNDARVKNRTELVRMITDVLMQNDREYWLEQFTGLG